MLASPKRSALISGTIHGGAILLILAVTNVKPSTIQKLHDVLWIPTDIDHYQKTALAAGTGGGGGGVHADSPASLGRPVEFKRYQYFAPAVQLEDRVPILSMEASLIGNPEIQPVMLNIPIGDPHGVLGKRSGGEGDGGGIGKGHGTGIGDGDGAGLGKGEGGGEGGGGVGFLGAGTGGSVVGPTVLYKTEPEYSEEARKARLQGTVLLRIEVGTGGHADHISVRQSLGLGLDERAMEAVKKWKFNPAKVNGKPTAVAAYVEVNFRLL